MKSPINLVAGIFCFFVSSAFSTAATYHVNSVLVAPAEYVNQDVSAITDTSVVTYLSVSQLTPFTVSWGTPVAADSTATVQMFTDRTLFPSPDYLEATVRLLLEDGSYTAPISTSSGVAILNPTLRVYLSRTDIRLSDAYSGPLGVVGAEFSNYTTGYHPTLVLRQIQVVNATAVPEPSALAVSVLATGLLMFRRRK